MALSVARLPVTLGARPSLPARPRARAGARTVAVRAAAAVAAPSAPSTSGEDNLSTRVLVPFLTVANVVTGALEEAGRRLALAFSNAVGGRIRALVDYEAINVAIRKAAKDLRVHRAIMIPFAAVSASGSASVFLLFVRAVASFMKLYLLLLFIRVLLSWFPQFNWDQQPWLTLRQLTDPYLNLFRGLVPPLLGQVDLTPLLGFWILQFLAGMMDVGDFEDEW